MSDQASEGFRMGVCPVRHEVNRCGPRPYARPGKRCGVERCAALGAVPRAMIVGKPDA